MAGGCCVLLNTEPGNGLRTYVEFETALAPVDYEGHQMIDARRLHKWLRVKRGFAHWITDRITDYSFEEASDFRSILTKTRGRPRTDYLLTLDMAKELAMVERTDIGRATRRYFIKMEQAAVKMAADHVANGMPEAIPQISSIF